MKKSMESKTTAYRNRKVTRTVEVMNLNVTAVDLSTKTVIEVPVSIPAVGFRSNKAMENAIIVATGNDIKNMTPVVQEAEVEEAESEAEEQ